jgi:hypothetical protein
MRSGTETKQNSTSSRSHTPTITAFPPTPPESAFKQYAPPKSPDSSGNNLTPRSINFNPKLSRSDLDKGSVQGSEKGSVAGSVKGSEQRSEKGSVMGSVKGSGASAADTSLSFTEALTNVDSLLELTNEERTLSLRQEALKKHRAESPLSPATQAYEEAFKEKQEEKQRLKEERRRELDELDLEKLLN